MSLAIAIAPMKEDGSFLLITGGKDSLRIALESTRRSGVLSFC